MARTIEFDIEVNGLDELAQSGLSARQQLKLLQEALNNEKLSGEKLQQAERAAGQLRDRIGDVRQRINALASDTGRLDAFVSGVRGIAAGFAVAQGAAALFGSENENLQQAILKTQGALTLLNGVQEVANVLNKDSAFSIVATATAQRALAAATTLASGSLGVFRTALIATGIGAAVVAVGLLVANWDKLSDAISGSNEEIRENTNLNKEVAGNITKEVAALTKLKIILEDENISRSDKLAVLKEEQKNYPERLNNIKLENDGTVKNIELLGQQIELIKARELIRLRVEASAKETLESQNKIEEIQLKIDELRSKPLGFLEAPIIRNAQITNLQREQDAIAKAEVEREKKLASDINKIRAGIKSISDPLLSTQKAADIVAKKNEDLKKDVKKETDLLREGLDEQLLNYDNYITDKVNAYKKDFVDGIITNEEDLTRLIEQEEIERFNGQILAYSNFLNDIKLNTKLSVEERSDLELEFSTKLRSIYGQLLDFQTGIINKANTKSVDLLKSTSTQTQDFIIRQREDTDKKLKALNDKYLKDELSIYRAYLLEQQKESVKQQRLILDGNKENVLALDKQIKGDLNDDMLKALVFKAISDAKDEFELAQIKLDDFINISKTKKVRESQDLVVDKLFEIFEKINNIPTETLSNKLELSSSNSQLSEIIELIDDFESKYKALTNNPPFRELLNFKETILGFDKIIKDTEYYNRLLEIENSLLQSQRDGLKLAQEAGDTFIIDDYLETISQGEEAVKRIQDKIIENKKLSDNRALALQEKYNQSLANLQNQYKNRILSSEEDLSNKLNILRLQRLKQEESTRKQSIESLDKRISDFETSFTGINDKGQIEQLKDNEIYKLLLDEKSKLYETYLAKQKELSDLEIQIITDTLNKRNEVLNKFRTGLIVTLNDIGNIFNITGEAYEVGFNGIFSNISNTLQRLFRIQRNTTKKELEKLKADKKEAEDEASKAGKDVTPEQVGRVKAATDAVAAGEKNIRDFRRGIASVAASSLGELGNTIAQIGDTITQNRLDRLQTEAEAELSILEDRFNRGLISESEYNNTRLKLNEKYQEEETKIKKKAFNIDKAAKISQAVAATALAVITALSAGPIAGPILAGLAGALGAVQVGIIAAQKFEGGSSQFNNSNNTGGGASEPAQAPAAPTSLPRFNVNTGSVEGSNLLMGSGLTGNRNTSGVQQVVVSETDIREVSTRVEEYKRRGQFG
jgi:hypothetical protein